MFCLSLSHYGSQGFHLSQQGQARFSRSTRLPQVTSRFITHFYSPKFQKKKKKHFPLFLTFPFTLMLAHMHRHTHTYQKATLHKLPIISAALNCRCVCVSSGCAWIRWIINLLVALTLCLIAVPEQQTHAHTKGRINRVTHREEHDDMHCTVTHKSLCVFFHESRAWNPTL